MHRLPVVALGADFVILFGLTALPETRAGWSRLLAGQNPGGPNGMLVLIQVALVLLGGMMLLGTLRSRRRR